jgi:hypothetical protein
VSSQDDPEARIRDLERSLADSYYEPGTSSPGDQYPPPTAPWRYDAPAPPRRGRGGLVAAIGITALLAVVGTGVAIYLMTSGGSSTTSGRATFSGGGGGFPATTAPSRPRTAPTPAPAPAPAPGSTVMFSGIGETETVHCDNNSVSVSGIDNVVTITGHCLEVTVSGVRNTVNVESVDAIGISGLENRVTYRVGAPQVNQSGFDNVVEQGG